MNKILIIQTAFIGDVILATAVVEKLKLHFPDGKIDFLLRKGNESLLQNNPHINQIFIWNKKQNKYQNFLKILKQIRITGYDLTINLQRFSSSGIMTVFSNTKRTIGFDKNPFSLLFTERIRHKFGNENHPIHEVHRNLKLIEHLTDSSFVKPRL